MPPAVSLHLVALETASQADRQAGKQAGRQTGRQAGRQWFLMAAGCLLPVNSFSQCHDVSCGLNLMEAALLVIICPHVNVIEQTAFSCLCQCRGRHSLRGSLREVAYSSFYGISSPLQSLCILPLTPFGLRYEMRFSA